MTLRFESRTGLLRTSHDGAGASNATTQSAGRAWAWMRRENTSSKP